ncbi:MAG TPA: MFS transporter [Gemmataceae bacterium]|nr:MFS transporter [Gemmataceae bacterium]
MRTARWRLASLWVSQTARVLADWSLRTFVVLHLAAAGGSGRLSAWHLATAAFIAPFLLLAPFNGAVCNGLRKRLVLIGSAAFCLSVVAGFLLAGGPWLVCLGVFAVGAALYSPTRYALLPAAAADTGFSLVRINGWVEMGGSVATVAGVLVGWELQGQAWAGLPAALAVALAASVVGLLTALPVRFPSDVYRPEPPLPAVAGFFRDTRRILADREARGCLLGLAGFMALVIAGSGAVVAHSLPEGDAPDGRPVHSLLLVGLGVAAGSWLAGVQKHPRRSLGLIPFGAVGLAAALVWAAAAADLRGPSLLMGAMAGLANVPLRAAYQAAVPADARGNGMAASNTANYLATTVLAGLVVALVQLGLLPTANAQLWLLTALSGLGAVVYAWVMGREALEQVGEILFWPLNDVRPHGPGLPQVPHRGPLLVIANHTAWLDPLWLGKLLPRRVTPMMTSDFYDLPGLRLLMRFFGVIRVPAVRYKREAPELAEAIAALDRGECVLIFPEGMVRRREDVTLRQFAQGVWHILSARPGTPVLPCWIEGGWGSFTSHKGGPPMRGKPIDLRRRIDIAVGEPCVLGKDLLADQRATRAHLMRLCLESRKLLGLAAAEPEAGRPAVPARQETDPV